MQWNNLIRKPLGRAAADSASLMASPRDVLLVPRHSPVRSLSLVARSSRRRERGPTERASPLFPHFFDVTWEEKGLACLQVVQWHLSYFHPHLIKFKLGEHCRKHKPLLLKKSSLARTICFTPKIGPLIFSASADDFNVLRLRPWRRLSSLFSSRLPHHFSHSYALSWQFKIRWKKGPYCDGIGFLISSVAAAMLYRKRP